MGHAYIYAHLVGSNNKWVGVVFRLISITPTTDEAFFMGQEGSQPYLPCNKPTAYHHLPADSLDRVLDIHFRLLRHDVLHMFWSALHDLPQFQLLVCTAGGAAYHPSAGLS